MKSIYTEKAPKAIGPYSQAMVSGGFVFTSGQIPINPETGDVVVADIFLQTEQVMKNLSAVLQAAGSDLTRVVKATCFLASMDDFDALQRHIQQIHDQQPRALLRRGEDAAQKRALRGGGHRGGLDLRMAR